MDVVKLLWIASGTETKIVMPRGVATLCVNMRYSATLSQANLLNTPRKGNLYHCGYWIDHLYGKGIRLWVGTYAHNTSIPYLLIFKYDTGVLQIIVHLNSDKLQQSYTVEIVSNLILSARLTF